MIKFKYTFELEKEIESCADCPLFKALYTIGFCELDDEIDTDDEFRPPNCPLKQMAVVVKEEQDD